MAASCLRPLLLALLLAGACPVSATDPGEIVLGARCREEWTKYLAQPNPGFFYYAEDPASGKHQCGASASDGFDRYPSREQEAFTACQNAADEAGIASRCRLMARGSRVGARSYGEAAPAEEFLTEPGLRCGQTPRNRFFWTEAAFCDTTLHGPERAAGLVIWNHGVMGKEVQHATLVPPAFRLLQARGWDVIRLNRHNLAEDQDSLGRASTRLLEEVAAQRKRGYQKVVVAGQSFGGLLSLETATRSRDIFAAVAFAPGLRRLSRAESFDARPVTWRLPSLVVERVAVVFPAQDALFRTRPRPRSHPRDATRPSSCTLHRTALGPTGRRSGVPAAAEPQPKRVNGRRRAVCPVVLERPSVVGIVPTRQRPGGSRPRSHRRPRRPARGRRPAG